MHYFRPVLLTFISLLLFNTVFSQKNDQSNPDQETENRPNKERFFTGGGFGLGFGTVTNLSISPILGYRFNDYVALGARANYQYYINRYYNPTLQSSIFGGSIFARAYPIEQLFVHAEYEYLTYKTSERIFNAYQINEFIPTHNLLIGGGYREWIGGRSYATIVFLYNINQTIYTPYSNPVIRAGLEIGL